MRQKYVLEVYERGRWVQKAVVTMAAPKGKASATLFAIARPAHMKKQA
jgi:hypothetical protein